MVYSEQDLLTAARTVYGEARGEPFNGQVAVAWVIRNRASRVAFAGPLAGHPGSVDFVCTMPWQFSCWNENDPNRAVIENLQWDDPALAKVQDVVTGVFLCDTEPDPTNGADHYHTIAKPAGARVWPPYWAKAYAESARVGSGGDRGHVFYNSLRRIAAA